MTFPLRLPTIEGEEQIIYIHEHYMVIFLARTAMTTTLVFDIIQRQFLFCMSHLAQMPLASVQSGEEPTAARGRVTDALTRFGILLSRDPALSP